MTTTIQPQTATKPASNPHLAGYWITLVAIPVVFIGAMWGATNQPEHASVSYSAFAVIVALHFLKRAQRALWNRRHGAGQ
jgi:hypothetical protein